MHADLAVDASMIIKRTVLMTLFYGNVPLFRFNGNANFFALMKRDEHGFCF